MWRAVLSIARPSCQEALTTAATAISHLFPGQHLVCLLLEFWSHSTHFLFYSSWYLLTYNLELVGTGEQPGQFPTPNSCSLRGQEGNKFQVPLSRWIREGKWHSVEHSHVARSTQGCPRGAQAALQLCEGRVISSPSSRARAGTAAGPAIAPQLTPR